MEMEYHKESVRSNILTLIDQLSDFVESATRNTGDTEQTCQRRMILNRIQAVEQAVNGIEAQDLY